MSFTSVVPSGSHLPLNPPPPPPAGMMSGPGPQLANPHFDPTTQIHMIQNQAQQHLGLHQMQQIQLQQRMMHPAMNDAPLDFNVNKNKPPMPVQGDDALQQQLQALEDNNKKIDDRRDYRDRRDRERRDRRDRDRERDDKKEKSREKEIIQVGKPQQQQQQDQNVSTNPVSAQMSAMNPMLSMNPMMGMMSGMMGMNPMMPMMGGMMGDPSMMGMSGMGQYGMMSGMLGENAGIMSANDTSMNMMDPSMVQGQRGVIECKDCTLIPPSPNAPPPVTRERPPGCKTVFIGGIPDNCTEDIIRDVFGRCGEMQTVRLSKKNFCHIRFVYEASVDAAIYLSGYRMRIGNNTDPPNTGRLHVDYAQARDDQYEYECRQRALQREQRHRERMERERMRPASPPPVAHYSDHEAMSVSEKIKTDEGFQKSVQMVITWLERGDCSKRNSNSFYTMIQSTNSHVRRLLNEKMQFEEELQSAKDLHRTRVQGIVVQFGLIEKVFNCASHKKCWDHFTKAQRKNIETWKKQTAEIKQIQLGDNLNEEAEEEMDFSDNDDEYNNTVVSGGGGVVRKKLKIDKDTTEANHLKDENDSLRCQLEAYKNEVDLVRNDLKSDLMEKDKQVKVLQLQLQTLQKQLLDSKRRQAEDELKVKNLQTKLKTVGEVKRVENGEGGDTVEMCEEGERVKEDAGGIVTGEDNEPVTSPSVSAREALLIGLISTFLHVHPFGAGVDYVWSFLTKIDPYIRPNEVETLMSKYPTVFKQELSGIGASMERRWIFIGFTTNQQTE